MVRIRVLLVEEDLSVSQQVKRALAMQDALQGMFDIHSVNCLADALEAVNEGAFNIVLLNLNLPDSSGIETLDAIHAENHLLPIVILTSVDDPNLEEAALKRGAQQCLRKLDLGGLVEAMRKAIRIRLHGPGKVQTEVESLLNDLNESINASKQALSKLDTQRSDPAERDAVQSLRLHLGTMVNRISAYRQDCQ